MPQTVYLQAQLATTGNKEHTFKFTAIGTGCFVPSVNGEGKRVCLNDSNLLNKIAKGLKGKPVFRDHINNVGNVIGGVLDAWVEGDRVRGTLQIVDEKIQKLLELDPPPIKDLSIDAYVQLNEATGEILDITEVEGISLVLRGAYPDAKIDASKPIYKSFLDPNVTDCVADTEWDADKAVERILQKGGYKLLAKTCLVVEFKEGEQDLPEAKSRYSFPLADIVNGKLCWVKKAISSAKAYLHGARGVEISPEKKRVAEEALNKLLKKLEKEVNNMDCKELQEKVAQLEAELKKATEEKQKLEAELQKRELEAYKLEAMQKLPESVRELAKVAMNLAKTKEEVDLVVKEYSEKGQKLQASAQGVPAINPAEGQNDKQEILPYLIV
jgi:hypothetical protein